MNKPTQLPVLPKLARRFGAGAALATMIAAASLSIPTTHAVSDSPVGYSADLGLIQAQLLILNPPAIIPPAVAATQPTLVIPAPAGFRPVNDKELAAALAAAITDETTNNTGGASVDTSTLTFKAAQYLPKKAAKLMAAAVTASPTEAELIVDAAIRAVPLSAPAIAAEGIKALVLTANTADADDVAGSAIEEAKTLAAKITASAIKAAKKSGTPAPAAQAAAITQKIVTEVLDSNVAFAIEEVTKAAVKAGATLGATPGSIAASVILGIEAAVASDNTAANQAAATAAAVLAAPGNTAAIKTAVQGASLAFDTEIGVAADAADAVLAAPAAGPATTTLVGANQAYADIVTQAAQQAKPKESVEIVKAALDAYNGTVTGTAIVSSAVRGNPAQAGKIAAEAARNFTDGLNVQGSLDGGDAAGAAVAGAEEKSYGAIVTAVLKAVPAGASNSAADVVATAIAAAFAASETNGKAGLDDIAKAAVKGRKLELATTFPAAVVAAPALAVAADPTITSLIAAGLVAGNTKAVGLDPALVASLKTARADDSDSAINAADVTARATAANKKDFYNVALGKFADVAVNTTTGDAFGIIYGSAVINSKGAAALAAAAIAESTAASDDVKAAATRTNRKLETGVGISVDVAVLTKANKVANPFGAIRVLTDPNYLAVHTGVFDIVSENTYNNPKNAVYVTTGAVAVQPDFSNVIAKAALFRAPGSSGKIIPAIFAYARLNVNALDTPSAASAITAQGLTGILDAKLDLVKAGSELKALKAATSAAVKAAAGLTGPNISQHAGVIAGGAGATLTPSLGAAGAAAGAVSQIVGPGAVSASNTVLSAVVTAAVKAGKKYYLEIAQAAVQTAVAVYELDHPGLGSTYDIAGIVTAIKAAAASSAKFDHAKIDLVAAYGKTQGAALVNGAGAAGIAFYAHHNATGPAVTDISGF